MHDVQPMHVVQREQELLDDRDSIPLSEPMLPPNHVEEVAPSDKLHHDIVAPSVFHQLKDASDVRMDGLLQYAQLILVQLLEHFIALERLLTDYLDRARDLRQLVLAKLYRAKRPIAQLPAYRVMVLEPRDFLKGSLRLE